MRPIRVGTHGRAIGYILSHRKVFPPFVKKKSLSGKKVVITAGPSREAIDPVRFLSNYSSGRMGYALSEAAVALGADTTLISGPTNLASPAGVTFVPFESTAQLHQAVVSEFEDADCLIMAAAPADFRPSGVTSHKIKRGGDALNLTLEPTVDILRKVASGKRKGQFVVGFALETDNALENARRKLREKNLDLIVLNTVGDDTGFNSNTNRITLIRPHRKTEIWPLMDKREIAMILVEKIASLL